ncbi:MAG: hypothetical protein JXR25_07315, partial [Pontiellaceae bacterium]|nr:hypothetical protein [Pontiellaceae bacterium]MBN2784621.1 hypothetical protein [Pontiellaceae bacterium]
SFLVFPNLIVVDQKELMAFSFCRTFNTQSRSLSIPVQRIGDWRPIEQDYYNDGLAFNLSVPRPPNLLLKTGAWSLESTPILAKDHTIRIGGGAATLLGLPLDPEKELKSQQLRTLSSGLIIGLMAVTL